MPTRDSWRRGATAAVDRRLVGFVAEVRDLSLRGSSHGLCTIESRTRQWARARSRDDSHFTRVQYPAVAREPLKLGDRRTRTAFDDFHWWSTRASREAVPPLHQRHQDGKEGAPFFGQMVFEPAATFGGGTAL